MTPQNHPLDSLKTLNSIKFLMEDATIEQFAQAQLYGALGKIIAMTRQRPELSPALDYEPVLQAVTDVLDKYQHALLSSIQEIRNDRETLLSLIKGVPDPNLKDPDTIIVRFGNFDAARRRPGELSGMAAGRVPALTWNELPLNSSEIPTSLRSAIAGIEAGLLQGLEYTRLPFCPEGVLWHLWFPAGPSRTTDADAFVIVFDGLTGQDLYMLDWTNEPFYRLSELKRFRFSSHPNIYIRCFYHLVRGKSGRFIILENEQDLEERIPWRRDIDNAEAAKSAAKENIRQFLAPLTRKSFNASGGAIYRACILFKNALFHADVVLDPSGTIELANEDLKLEDLPVNATNELGTLGDSGPTNVPPTEGS